jgi:hypothetical protein
MDAQQAEQPPPQPDLAEELEPCDEFYGPYSLVPMNYGVEKVKGGPPTLGSVYTSITDSMLSRSHWSKKKSAAGRFHCLFGASQVSDATALSCD